MKNPLKVLIADDSPFIVSRLKTLLEDIDSVNVVGEACNGNEVMDFFKTLVPDVVLLDITMPGMNGMDVLSGLKKEYSEVKVIMLTNQSNPFIRNMCMDLGANYFFDKSTEFEKLTEVLQQLSSVSGNLCLD